MNFLKRIGYVLLIMLITLCLHVGHKFLDSQYTKSYNDMLLYTTVAFVAGLMTNNKWD
jgi:hypothetical protein